MIKVKNLYKRFGEKEVLKDLTLEVKTGETLVILGRSGVGKSVLLRLIMGLETADRGEVYLDDVCLSSLREAALYKAIKEMGMLFQAGALFDSMTIEENTGFYLKAHGNYSEEEIKEKVHEALKMVGLSNTEKMMPSDLSGGMRKRAALARVIVYRPKVLLYDEPTTGLDPITAMQINELILKTQQELGATSIVVTHDLASAFHVADRIALNDEGTIKYITSKEQFVKIEDPTLQTFLKNAMPNGDLLA